MGNSNNLAYDIQEPVDYSNNASWTLHTACKKEEDEHGKRAKVSVFRFMKSNGPDMLALAQRNVQKLRTIRHPFILTFVDSLETEESVLLVTEPCIPLELWLKKVHNNDPSIPKSSIHSELTWGFKCILQGLDFIHSQASLLHGNLSPQAIFITPNGDWKIGSFELAANFNNNEDVAHFMKFQHLLPADYVSPERKENSLDKLKAQLPPYYIDMYSFGKCLLNAYSSCNEEVSGSFGKYVALTVSPEMKKRPSGSKLLAIKHFNSDYIKIMESIQEFNIKGPKEILEVMAQMDPLLPETTVGLCSYKLLPSLYRVLQRALTDFGIRDMRETSRQSIVMAVEMLSKLASLQKLDKNAFENQYKEVMGQLWALSDRSVRTALLGTLKNLVEYLPEQMINKSIFDHMVAGFADSNAKMRESTLMSLIFVVDRLDEVHLQDRLVRCVLNLQSDTEASIRTNTIIFIGKIAHKLKEAVQQRVLCNALIKAMKDPFLHCRLAAIKTALATIKLIDIPQIAGKLMPQCSVMLLDKHPDVRGMSITLLETCVETMKKYHAQMIEQQQAAAAAGKQQQQQQGDQIGQGESGDYLGSSWNVLQNLVSPTAVRSTSSGSLKPSTGGSSTGLSTYNVPPSPSAAAQPPAPQMTSSGKLLPKSAIQVDDDWDDMDTGNPLPSSKSTSMLDQDDTTSTGRWGDELDALDLDDMDLGHSAESLNTSKPSKPPVSVPVSPPSFETPDKKKPLPKAKPKVAVKKLQVDNDEKWDDF